MSGAAGRSDFRRLQAGLGAALEANRPGSGVEHVLIALPSFSVGESLLSHYANRIASLEHRYLLGSLLLGRIESCEFVFVSSAAPDPEVLAYYAFLSSGGAALSAWSRFKLFTVPDISARSAAAKLLDRPDLIDSLRATFRGRPALIEPWNVTDAEVDLACRLGVPINGASPSLWERGFKSAGRRLFARVGVPAPIGREDVQTVDDVVDAIGAVRRSRPGLRGVVLKLDNSGAGDGNRVLDLVSPGAADSGLRGQISALEPWYLDELAAGGGVVEELITGNRFTSPSAQLDIHPNGQVLVLATHEQDLGGQDAQVYLGCRFPADPAYAPRLARYARAVGAELAREGIVGRVSVDFAAAQDVTGRWSVYALEVNLRKGGTTHPYTALRNLVPGRYDADTGRWVSADGSERAYLATDNLIDDSWRGASQSSAIDAIAGAGLHFNRAAGTGVVLHMLSGLAIDGRLGMTVIGKSPTHAQELHDEAVAAIARSLPAAAPGGA